MNPSPPQISAKDRLGMTLFLAAALHAILILGVGFKALSDHLQVSPPKLDVVLVQTSSRQAPKNAQYLAQANQLASGSREKSGRPGAAFSAPNPSPSPGISPKKLHASRQPVPRSRENIPVLTQHHSPYELPQISPSPPSLKPHAAPTEQAIKLNLRQAQLAAEINRSIENYNKIPRRLFLDTLNAKSSVEAGYLARWVRRVERVGNLNYPKAAARRHLHGQLILNVLIGADGHVLSVKVAKSSGSPILDQAAKRIVRLAAPFPPFPPTLRKRYDQIMITRTWIFEPDNRLKTHG